KTRFSEATDPQTKEKFAVLDCTNCGFAETHPQPENLETYYAEYYGKRHGFTNDYCAWRRIIFLEKSCASNNKSKRLLDVGCGDGTFLNAAKKRGWNICGTELNAGRFEDSELEIYKDLQKVQESAFELLAPEGILFVAVPDARGFQAKIFGKYWLHLDVPRHLFHFDFNSLKMLLKQTNFAVKTHWHQEF
ncbi:MAG TPA: class I SAM-dependent methyltransferase, partial [Pyrinomonadaceae bacterium]|nr:class I SAM-dependent methyltransferase [Pyrinomonadaceae bacterium]